METVSPDSSLPLDDSLITTFQRQLLAWYDLHRRNLPWRGDPDPYHILVSEVMLQQTGVERVRTAYTAFLEQFPTLMSLAQASTAEVLRAWRGMGYNRRALNLKRAAEVCRDTYSGQLPATIAELEQLPGIGRYTARAVACFGFGIQTEVVDTNVRRVLSGLVGRDLSVREAEDAARQLLPPGQAADWNQALMDYGAMVYKATPKRRKTATEPFVTTNRFWRGRIIDALRQEGTLSLPVLLETLPSENREEGRVRELVRVLHEEGMVSYDAEQDVVSLPA
jgi:A/G-specific adenine glycosylase